MHCSPHRQAPRSRTSSIAAIVDKGGMKVITALQAQASMEEDFDMDQSIPDQQGGGFPSHDSASSALPAREAPGGFRGAFKKVANGIAGTAAMYCCESAGRTACMQPLHAHLRHTSGPLSTLTAESAACLCGVPTGEELSSSNMAFWAVLDSQGKLNS